jgi:hypothetical protein
MLDGRRSVRAASLVRFPNAENLIKVGRTTPKSERPRQYCPGPPEN